MKSGFQWPYYWQRNTLKREKRSSKCNLAKGSWLLWLDWTFPTRCPHTHKHTFSGTQRRKWTTWLGTVSKDWNGRKKSRSGSNITILLWIICWMECSNVRTGLQYPSRWARWWASGGYHHHSQRESSRDKEGKQGERTRDASNPILIQLIDSKRS